jgi:hypothetical protein
MFIPEALKGNDINKEKHLQIARLTYQLQMRNNLKKLPNSVDRRTRISRCQKGDSVLLILLAICHLLL